MKTSIVAIVVIAVLFVVAAFLVGIWLRKRNPYVVGEEYFRATVAEERRKARGDTGKSPMPEGKYDFWRGEQSLLDPTPTPLDSALTELVRSFAKSDEETRASMRASISMDEFYTLLTYSSRAAVFALRDKNAEWVVDGLAALTMIEKERVDYRDIVLSLELLSYSAARVGADANQLANAAAVLSEDEVANLIVEVMKNRDPQEEWGVIEVETEHGAGFIDRHFQDYKPKYDLAKMAIELATLISADKYQTESIAVAAELPRNWLEQENNEKTLDLLLKSVRAGAVIHARLRPDQHPTHDGQILMLFLVEVESESAAQELLALARQKNPEQYGAIALAEGRSFCLVIGRSYLADVKSFETSSSLARFSGGMTEIMKRHVSQ